LQLETFVVPDRHSPFRSDVEHDDTLRPFRVPKYVQSLSNCVASMLEPVMVVHAHMSSNEQHVVAEHDDTSSFVVSELAPHSQLVKLRFTFPQCGTTISQSETGPLEPDSYRAHADAPVGMSSQSGTAT